MSPTGNATRRELPTSRQLLGSTGLAAAVAAVLLATVILPLEYGIDPTGFGAMTGLVETGERAIAPAATPARSD